MLKNGFVEYAMSRGQLRGCMFAVWSGSSIFNEPHEKTYLTYVPNEESNQSVLLAAKMRPGKILIRLRECAGWSEFSLGTQFKPGTINRIIDWLSDKFHKNDYRYRFANTRLFDFFVYHIYLLYSDASTPYHTLSKIWTSTIYYPMLCLKIGRWVATA